ncbi:MULTISPECIES: bifunctional demethylmenaquinone methyltransferase/2-methoxy-6-polyprenyl-1,4-benzoquinol methylase UbiE [Acidobacteriaceae]|uniref:bifunctional demethylmenaquinone methyltransferase/2-methoxy-6-polyprenyl-1,4-benzoquinol methylase UbiE n=1 Tax=Acidobacteriaceae TaxID=204434 RepID=UPI00131AE8F6|nr:MULTISPECIES: bifunctional demethylmenaquinone methyltransferase/2-methoxy-6-polyprenyl-1,4-benzoquinol methylase UbiE [Acidobacteriaceae]MDW5264216.1 bifunctional demethylmenaquinone methyltransferase/2-methoxy-6-polyprenyl-1,4-benzoquinol methylase UbiE [Edaphobacter sp.]
MSAQQNIPEHTTGARPTGTTTDQDAAANVQQMFDTIAPKYDLLNHVLSVGIDRWWWSRAARTFRPILQRPESVALDLCCGTGDMTLALLKHRPNQQPVTKNQQLIAPLLAVDFSHQMLSRGAEKFAPHNIIPIEADALHLPIADNSIDLVTSAFGFRNLSNYEAGLAELHRILRPGGQIGILDFNQPTGLTGAFYNVYFKQILPRFGGLISGDPAAYTYLPDSVGRFPSPSRMIELIQQAGFTDTTWTSYTFGTAGLYRATKP